MSETFSTFATAVRIMMCELSPAGRVRAAAALRVEATKSDGPIAAYYRELAELVEVSGGPPGHVLGDRGD